MVATSRLRALRIILLSLATLIAIPASFVIRGVFFPTKLDVPSIKGETTYQDASLMERAWQLPVAATYRSGLFYQTNGSLCGPTSVANVQRSLGKLAASADSVVEGTGKCWSGACMMGLTLDELAEVARHATGRKVTLLRDLSLQQFREELRHVNELGRRYIVNFQRAPLFAQGGGHHSPIAGYLEVEDLVLVLDVNEKFKPWLVKADRLFKAVDTSDGDKKRGLLRIE
ncbi:MAG TPA: phytochelatin synthase family protein [Polyangiaceae bacterium]|nr:phytochelatin synthase family protein [Polyangiaceae bacterium]